MPLPRLKIGILLSGRGRGSNMQAIIDACHSGLVPGQVVRVISTTPESPALARARAAGVDALFVDPNWSEDHHGDTETRRSHGEIDDGTGRVHPPPVDPLRGYPRAPAPSPHHPISPSVSPCFRGESSLDLRLIAAFREVGADTIALAGFMRKLGPAFLEAFPQRILNIHPALLPCFGGQGFYGRRVHEAVLESGARFSGATVHFVDELYDHGPILLQSVVPVLDDDTLETLAARVLEAEHRLYPEALRLLALRQLEIRGRRVLIRGEG
jgi:phosphoribosylglycinamide formyltransferase-1